MSEHKYIYGYGKTKHIPSGAVSAAWSGYVKGTPIALCGAHGGYPTEEPERPTCKRCLSKVERSKAPDLMAALEESLAAAKRDRS